MKFWKIILIVVLATAGFWMSLKFNNRKMSFDTAAKTAIAAVVDKSQGKLKTGCVSADVEEQSSEVISFAIREIHNEVCGGDPNTAPLIERVLINLKSGEVTFINI